MTRRFVALGLVAVLVVTLVGGCAFWQFGPTEKGLFPDPLDIKGPAPLDRLFTAIAQRAPAFGGMFLDETGTLNVYLVDLAQRNAVEAAIAEVLGAERTASQMKPLQGRYSFGQLKNWHDKLMALFEDGGVVFTDIDETRNMLKVGIEIAGLKDNIEKKLDKLGVPRDAVAIEEAEPVVLMATLRDRIRPLQGGLQIAFSLYLCTLGFNGIRAGVPGIVTNSHCTDKQGGVESTKHYQPSVATDNFIGTEIADPRYFKGGVCPRGKVCRYSDSAFSQLASGVTADLGYIERTTALGSITIAGSYRVVSEATSNALVGETLNKVGRTTGWSQGNVTNSCVNVAVSGTNIVQLCQDFVGASVGSGDSGSPVFRITNSPSANDVQLYGILWGGNSAGTSFVYSPMANVQRSDELGALTTCASGFSC
ncbi:S1 family peptidase [Candidatus Acetothermia bacterium]|nr:S1 family peptidase [Candidatus Acetothermia bacterium]MCI2431902.1 S1 family peptidase [Candidatus Acetothermia bacterium]MCI2437365.1 S1 family peptidase [Candidatus Acetothermia bacterium]